jgi:hypothetical protein
MKTSALFIAISDKQVFKLQPNETMYEDFCVPSEEESFNQGVRDPAGALFNNK